jgi:hypothetical protein
MNITLARGIYGTFLLFGISYGKKMCCKQRYQLYRLMIEAHIEVWNRFEKFLGCVKQILKIKNYDRRVPFEIKIWTTMIWSNIHWFSNL